jgi:hypothetical protein
VALGQVFSEYFAFLANLHSTNCSKNHPHLSSGVCTIGQSGRSTRDLDTYGLSPTPLIIKKYRDLGDLNKET